MPITLMRVLYNHSFTKGILTYNDEVLCHTLELPWLDNARNISCIPDGVYDVIRYKSQRFSDCFRFVYVPNRIGILLHAGNTVKDTQGCILPGLDTAANSVIKSKDAMYRLLSVLPDKFKLTIRSL